MDKQIGINWGLYLSSFTGTFMYFLEFMPNYIYDIGIPYFLDVKLWHVNLAPPSQTQLSKLWNSPGYDPVSGLPHPRRLDEDMTTRSLKESLAVIEANRPLIWLVV